ncbi:hypothetical protein [Alicyclobacillus pomorum]|uniref:hypothetical protein n=1 Tax=Alicyclobacillus pomorum TaxID=204470 RepID=UPI00041C2580|nr:hypothetical protein [Alicyclobacillus pomorum]
MDNFIHRVQTPKVPQYVGRTTSVSDLAKVIRDGEKPHSNVSEEVQAKSPAGTGVAVGHPAKSKIGSGRVGVATAADRSGSTGSSA